MLYLFVQSHETMKHNEESIKDLQNKVAQAKQQLVKCYYKRTLNNNFF